MKLLKVTAWSLLAIFFLLLPAYFAVPLVVDETLLSGPVYEEEFQSEDGQQEIATYQMFIDVKRGISCSVAIHPGNIVRPEGYKTSRPGCIPRNLTTEVFGWDHHKIRLLVVILVAPLWGLLVAVLFAISHPRTGKRLLLRFYLAVKIHARRKADCPPRPHCE